MANNIIKRVWNQNRMANIEDLCGMAFQAESGGHTFEITGVDDTGAAVPLSGTVTGVFRRPDNADIALIGAASGGVVSVTLTDDCYAVTGRFGLTVFVTSNGQKTAVYAAVGTVAATNGGAVAGDTPQDVVDLINAIAAAVATIPADYTDLMAAVAPNYSPSALYPVGAYVWYNGDLYRCTTPITTAETWTAAHWTASNIGHGVSILQGAMQDYNSFPISENWVNHNNATHNGVTFAWAGTKCKLTGGTSASPAVNALFYKDYSTMPDGLVAGGTYWASFECDNAGVKLGFVFYKNNSNASPTYKNIAHSEYFNIPADTTGVNMRLYVEANTTFSTPAIVSAAAILPRIPIYDLVYNGRDESNTIPEVILSQSRAASVSSLSDIPPYTLVSYVGADLEDILGEDWTFELSPSSTYYLFAFNHQSVPAGYIIMRLNGTEMYVGYLSSVDGHVYWSNVGYSAISPKKELKVLCLGNSYTQDSTVYAPYIIEGLTDSIGLTLGLSYYSGASLSDYSNWFDNDSATLTYNKKQYGDLAWSTSAGKTLKQILDDEPWDIIVLTQASADAGTWSTYSPVYGLIDKIYSRVLSVHGHGVKFGWLMPQLRRSIESTVTYDMVIECVENVLSTTVCQFVLPCCTAIQNARGTALNSLGDAGGLTADSNGHLQEGLPVLLSSYVTAMKLLELSGCGYSGVMADSTPATAAWVSARSIPGQNGSAIVPTSETRLLAQKCATFAVKKPFEVSDIV